MEASETSAEDRPAVRDRTRRDTPRLRLPHRPAAQQRQHAARRPRPASARDARRARPDVRQVRPAPLHAARRDAARHRRRVAKPAGRRHADRLRRRAAGDRGGDGAHDRAGVPDVRRDADRRRVHRSGSPRDAADRRRGGRQGAAARGAPPDRVGPPADAVGRPRRPRAGARPRLHRRRSPGGGVQPFDPAGARLPARGAERRDVPA